jgi:uncharacterized membrane protein
MKKYFKFGLSLLLPITLVIVVSYWVYNLFDKLTRVITPESWGYSWWYPLIVLVGICVAILLLGFIFYILKPLQWIKKQSERVISKMPVLNKVYNFGKDISDSFLSDIKEDGDLQVIEVMFAGQLHLGVITGCDTEGFKIVFVATAPNPLNGFVFKTKEYRIIDNMTFIEYVQFLASLGRINSKKWN